MVEILYDSDDWGNILNVGDNDIETSFSSVTDCGDNAVEKYDQVRRKVRNKN